MITQYNANYISLTFYVKIEKADNISLLQSDASSIYNFAQKLDNPNQIRHLSLRYRQVAIQGEEDGKFPYLRIHFLYKR